MALGLGELIGLAELIGLEMGATELLVGGTAPTARSSGFTEGAAPVESGVGFVTVPGGPTAGLFGIAFADAMNGLAVGGDYNIARGVTDFALRTSDGGMTWKLAGIRRPDGVTQGLALVPGTAPPVFVATGAHGTAFTRDFGATWVDGDTLTSFAVGFASPNVGWVAGPRGRVVKFTAVAK